MSLSDTPTPFKKLPQPISEPQPSTLPHLLLLDVHHRVCYQTPTPLLQEPSISFFCKLCAVFPQRHRLWWVGLRASNLTEPALLPCRQKRWSLCWSFKRAEKHFFVSTKCVCLCVFVCLCVRESLCLRHSVDWKGVCDQTSGSIWVGYTATQRGYTHGQTYGTYLDCISPLCLFECEALCGSFLLDLVPPFNELNWWIVWQFVSCTGPRCHAWVICCHLKN